MQGFWPPDGLQLGKGIRCSQSWMDALTLRHGQSEGSGNLHHRQWQSSRCSKTWMDTALSKRGLVSVVVADDA